MCNFGDASDMLAYVYHQSVMQSEQEAFVPSRSCTMKEKGRLAKHAHPHKTVNEHGTPMVIIIIIILASIININLGVSYPGLGSNIYGVIASVLVIMKSYTIDRRIRSEQVSYIFRIVLFFIMDAILGIPKKVHCSH